MTETRRLKTLAECLTQGVKVTVSSPNQPDRTTIMPQPQRPEVSTDLFLFTNNQFLAEASDLKGHPFNTIVTLVNPKTQGRVDFDLIEVKKDGEGDVQAWIYKAVDPPSRVHLSLIVFND